MIVSEKAALAGFDIAELRGAVAGPVLLPGDEGFAAEVATFNLNNPLRPAIAVGVIGAADIQAVVRFAARHDLPAANAARATLLRSVFRWKHCAGCGCNAGQAMCAS